ncbi:hypothetical protein IQ229_21875 [Nostoc cf. edaphicum LEGE 07299]|uniref:Uncharacterized protein n=1 Tax=Nostoc cf. edaphicum LEGE 07299 TaxID=2777974 RepID=A0ABR9U490_9NOSO|nr:MULTISPECIES: hypothetical protein [Nostoc]MBE8971174.1 hypothetical protein [Nostocales cyanobacterium LEGE 12452]MBE9107481.1 hypothetical protein [Nostoc cf. edaphicum LEGE 07299]MDZ7951765.1 hypothetical protein [Nostoc sp. DedQUE09]
MKPIKVLASACRYCRHYQPEGRRGGTCQQLGAPVQATWKACSLALPPFAPSWETLEDAWGLPDAAPVLTSCQSLASDLDNAALVSLEEITASISEQVKTKAVVI